MRVLFSSPIGPMPLVDGRDPLDPFTGQLSPAQGAFAMTLHGHYWALYLLAENLRAECCVLEHPSAAEFEAELARGYDLLGLQVNWNTLPQTADMVARARAVAPDTRIVIGGYALPQLLDPLPPDRDVAEVILEGVDHLCLEEGVRFMRRLIGDRPEDRAITQTTLPKSGGHLAALGPGVRATRSHPVLVSLGCPAGCDFCNTSAFFRRRKLRVAEPEEVAALMRHHLRGDGAEHASFELFDEDLFWDPQYSRDLGALLRADPETAGRVGYFAFGSVRTLSRFDPEELFANGLGTVWIGVESTLPEALRSREHLGKRKGRKLQALFDGLHDAGIHTVGSLVLGFDFHTPENVWRDVEAFAELSPIVSQITPLVPCAGTRLYERLKAKGRLDPSFGFTRSGAFEGHPPMVPLHLAWPQLQAVVAAANRHLFVETGPSALKGLDVSLRGHMRFRDSPDPVLRARAAGLGEAARRQLPILDAVLGNAPSERVRDRARGVRERWIEAFGRPSPDLVALGRAFAERVRSFAERPPPPPDVLDPPTRWTYYRPGAPPRVLKEAA